MQENDHSIRGEEQRRRQSMRDLGVDAPVDRRPGGPMEASPPHPMGAAHWQVPERQSDPGNILKRAGLEELTPVFGTSLPPRRLSGLMRRAAYKIPGHHTAHWLTLLLADRVDVLEHNLGVVGPLALGVGAAAGAAAFVAKMRPRRRRWPFGR